MWACRMTGMLALGPNTTGTTRRAEGRAGMLSQGWLGVHESKLYSAGLVASLY